MKKIIALLLSVTLMFSLLTACGKKAETNDAGNTTEPTKAAEQGGEAQPTENAEPTQPPANISEEAAQSGDLFPNAVNNTDPSITGGILKVALVADSAFAGVLNPVVYEDNYDSQVIQWFAENILSSDENFVFDQDGAATYEYDAAAKTVTLHMKDGVKWHDGEPVTLDDLVFAYEVISHKDYKGLRYEKIIVGLKLIISSPLSST
jgi:ABC-type transport system substrate-binding protein